MSDETIPDKVYSVNMLTQIKEHRVLSAPLGYLFVRVGSGPVGARRQPDGTWKYQYHRFYLTWEAAHTAALAQCHERIKQAEKEIASNKRAIKKLEGMAK